MMTDAECKAQAERIVASTIEAWREEDLMRGLSLDRRDRIMREQIESALVSLAAGERLG